jgi:hypothetical protein
VPDPDPRIEKHLATTIDILDPASRRVVTSRNLEGIVLTLLSPELGFTIRTDPIDGFAIFDVWRMRFRRGVEE